MKKRRSKKAAIPKMRDARLMDFPKKKHVLFSFTIGGNWHGCDKVSIIGGSGGGGS